METPDECVRRCSMESRSKCDHTNDSRNAANSVLRPQTTRELVSAADDTRISAVAHNRTLQQYLLVFGGLFEALNLNLHTSRR
jgi:hypothetical protein